MLGECDVPGIARFFVDFFQSTKDVSEKQRTQTEGLTWDGLNAQEP